ncbi:SigB/SigF/SigG family RNA polymerase sigma factor [Micromonosporaceae bacterium B7E4]
MSVRPSATPDAAPTGPDDPVRTMLDTAALRYARRAAGSSSQRQAALEELVRLAFPLVDRLARVYRNRGEPLDDLRQSANLGLMLAIARFDPERGAFSAYLIATVTGELKRHFRDHTWGVHVPRQLQELSQEYRRNSAALTQRLARHPTEAELAREIGVDPAVLAAVRQSAQGYRPASLDAPAHAAGDSGSTLADQVGEPDLRLDAVDDRLTVQRLLAQLPARERRILALRFYGNLTQAEIAERCGISQMHVSRLLSRALAWLRTALLSENAPAWAGHRPDPDLVPLWLRHRVEDGTAVVSVSGEVDHDVAGQLRDALLAVVAEEGVSRLQVDLSHVPLIDAAGMAALLTGYEASRAARKGFAVTGAPPFVARVLRLSGLTPLLRDR